MRLHLTPSFEATQKNLVVTHRYNTENGRIYNIDFKKPNSDRYYDGIIIYVPFDITQPIQFFKNEWCNCGKLIQYELKLDEDEKNIIKKLFYTFCHNHTDEAPKFAYIHGITWDYNPYSDEILPAELNIDISTLKGDNIYTEIQDSLQMQFECRPVSFSVITYTPYEESLYGVINVYPDYRLCDCTTYVYRHVNGKIECSSFESDFSDDDLHAGYELAKYVNENLNNANTHILENNHLSILENRDNHVAYYIANENHNDFVSRTEFMATMNMSVTTE